MQLNHRLLDHPFYKDWADGKISREQLAHYAKSYADFIERMPEYWTKIIESLEIEEPGAGAVIDDETRHLRLWNIWTARLPVVDEVPVMRDLLDSLSQMNPSELLGAIHAFEIQQPQVARTKKEGLIKHYGFAESALTYFDEHMQEAEHIAFGEYVHNHYADDDDFKAGFEKGSQLIYESLNLFVSAEC